jgi:hypothetical protein
MGTLHPSLDREKSRAGERSSTLVQKMKLGIETEIFPAATDGRLRQQGACGGLVQRHSTILLHEHNEMLHSDIF